MDPFDDGQEGIAGDASFEQDAAAAAAGAAAAAVVTDPAAGQPMDPVGVLQAAVPVDPVQQVPVAAAEPPVPPAPPLSDPAVVPVVPVSDPFAGAGAAPPQEPPEVFDPMQGLDIGRPPIPSGPNIPEGLRRQTSGIGGTRAPSWETVERELRQSELTDFLRRMFDTMGQQHQAIERLSKAVGGCMGDIRNVKTNQYQIQVVNEENQRVYHDEQAKRMEDQMDNLREQEQKLQLQRNAIADQTAEMSVQADELKAQADRLEKIEQDLGMKIQQAEEKAKETALGLESRLNEFGTKTDETLARLDDDRSRLGHEVAKSFSREQIEKKTLRQLVHELAIQHNKLCDIAKRERYGRLRLTGWMLADLNLKGVCRRFFTKWRSWTKMGKDLRDAKEGRETYAMVALTDIRREVPRRYFGMLKKFVEWARKQHVKADRCCKAIRRLNYSRSKATLRTYYDKFLRYLEMVAREREVFYVRNVERAKALEGITERSIMTRRFNRWLAFRNIRAQAKRRREMQLEVLDKLEALFKKALSGRYYEKLVVYYQWRKYQRKRWQLAVDLNTRREKNVRRDFLERWAKHAAMMRRFLERAAVSRALMTKNHQVLRREAWFLWSRYQRMREMQRERQEVDNRFADAARKTDNLSVQIDVGLKTLSNTNSVLNKLVDRLISVDSQLDILDKEKVARRELSLITDPTRHPELEEPPPRKPKRMTLNDPRTSPQPEPKPFDDYRPVVMQGTTERQAELEREREMEQLQEMQHTAEMEQSAATLEQLANTVSQLNTPHHQPEAPPGVPHAYSTATHPSSLPHVPSSVYPMSSAVHPMQGASAFLPAPAGVPGPQPQQPSFITPPVGGRHADVTPGAMSNQSGAADLAMQMRAEFDRELQSQRANYRNIGGLNTSGRFL